MILRRPLVPTFQKEIQRERLAAWFEATAAASARILTAPVGCGKTVAVKQYAARHEGRVAYVPFPAGADAREVQKALVAGRHAGEIILDDADRIEPAAYASLVEKIANGLIDTKVILVGRSRRRLGAQALLARGFAAAYDPAELAFDVAEIVALAEAFGVEYDAGDAAQLLHDTEGWAFAAHWLIRDAATNRRSLRDAFAQWRERNGHLLSEFVESEYSGDPDAFEVFRSLLGTSPGEKRTELSRLEQAGLPLVRTRRGARPYRILRRLAGAPPGMQIDGESTLMPPLMMLNVLGRFRCEIGGRPVPFSRRRDQNVFVFVAVAAEGRASREAVLDAFWPGVERPIAAQALRTTLSRIRRAILDAAPGVDPELYLQTSGELRVDWATVAVDVRRFRDLIEQGRFDDSRGATDGAKRHYRLAYCLYHDRLLASEPQEPCFQDTAKSLHALYRQALSRLTQLHAATGELDTAREYAGELKI